MSLSESKKNISIYLIILFLPFFLFYWMIPFISHVTIGSDYLAFPIKQQMELLFSIKTGSFPLYVPGFSGGHSSSALTLAQIFHPLPYLASMMPGYWEGQAVEWNNFFKLLSLGIAQLALFGFLRKTGLRVFFSFLLSLITVYNLRVPDMYRYGASLEAYTAFLILCSAIGWYFIQPTNWLGPLSITGAMYMLVCSGHPQMMYFGVLGTGLFIITVPFFLSSVLPAEQDVPGGITKKWLVIVCCLGLGILLSSSYILSFYYDFLKVNVDRVGQDYAWADSNYDSFVGTLNNFLLPLHSIAHSAFGGSSFTLMALLLPLLRVFKVKIPSSIWGVWISLLCMFLFMQGSRTPLHRLAWEYLPFASSMRIAGRISMIMPIFIMLLLTWVLRAEQVSPDLRRSSVARSPVVILGYLSAGFLAMYYLLYAAGYIIFSFKKFHEYFTYPVGNLFNVHYFWISSFLVVLGIVALILLGKFGNRKDTGRAVGIILIIVTFLQLGIVLKYRSAQWIETRYQTPTFEEIKAQKKSTLDYPYYPGGGLHSSIVVDQINRSFLEPFLGKIFTQVIPVSDVDDAYERMRSERLPQQVFVEKYDPEKARELTAAAIHMKRGTVKLAYSSYNRLEFLVYSEFPAVFGLSYPYTGNWRATVNGGDTRIYSANGAAHAVEIPAGESVVEFRYWSNAFFWGMIISLSTLFLIGLVACFRGLNGMPRFAGTGIILLVCFGLFILWYTSLYSGDNLDTQYSWSYTPPAKERNLAYGKKVWLSPSAIPMHWTHTKKEARVSKLVDGDLSSGSGFSSLLSKDPAFFLDLHKQENVKSINLYGSSRDPSVNVRPLTIALSDDGNTWNLAATVVSQDRDGKPARIIFEQPHAARYIRISASGESILSFDEIEVYGPVRSAMEDSLFRTG